MPTYSYVCRRCGANVERVLSIDHADDDPGLCSCGGKLKKRYGGASLMGRASRQQPDQESTSSNDIAAQLWDPTNVRRLQEQSGANVFDGTFKIGAPLNGGPAIVLDGGTFLMRGIETDAETAIEMRNGPNVIADNIKTNPPPRRRSGKKPDRKPK